MCSKNRAYWPHHIAKLLIVPILAALVFAAVPADALIQPRAWDWLARLNRLLPAEEKAKCDSLIQTMPFESTSEDVRAGVRNLKLRIPEEPAELYAAIRLLIRKDKELTRISGCLEQVKKGRSMLESYRGHLKKHRNTGRYRPLNERVQLPEPDYSSTNCIEDETSVSVLRRLPKEEKNWCRADYEECLKASSQDLEYLTKRQSGLEAEITAINSHTNPLRAFVRNFSDELDPYTGLKRSVKRNNGSGKFGIIMPPPPPDLTPIAVPEESSQSNEPE